MRESQTGSKRNKKRVAHTREKASPCTFVCAFPSVAFWDCTSKISGTVLVPSKDSAPRIRRVNNLTIGKHHSSGSHPPSVHHSHPSWRENRKRRGAREQRGRSRNGNMLDIWMCLRTTREGKLAHFRINPDKLQICNYTGFRACLLPIHSGISGCSSRRVGSLSFSSGGSARCPPPNTTTTHLFNKAACERRKQSKEMHKNSKGCL